MAKFAPGQVANPTGSASPRSSALVRSCRRTLAAFGPELIERVLAKALGGDDTALVAAVGLYAAALTAHAAELNLRVAKPQRKTVGKMAQADSA